MGDVLLTFTFSAAVIVAAGVLLTRCADKLAQSTRIGRALAGMVLLAGATSLPELSVDLSAVRRGSPDLAAGDLLGSSLVNLLILAVLDAAGVAEVKALGPASRGHAPKALLAALMTAWIGIGLASPINEEVLGAGFFVWTLPVVYAAGLRAARDLRADEENTAASWKGAAAGYVAGAALIFWTAPALAGAAEKLALATGLGQTFIGTTALALTTGLPEIVSTVTAYRIKRPELAVANIFGSNAFNMAIFLPLDWAHPGPLLAGLDRRHGLTAFAVLAVSIIAPLCQLGRPERPRRYLDPVSVGVIFLIFALLALLKEA